MEWLSFEKNKELFANEAKKNCECLFDCGTVKRYFEEHPFSILTHFKLASHNSSYETTPTASSKSAKADFS